MNEQPFSSTTGPTFVHPAPAKFAGTQSDAIKSFVGTIQALEKVRRERDELRSALAVTGADFLAAVRERDAALATIERVKALCAPPGDGGKWCQIQTWDEMIVGVITVDAIRAVLKEPS